MKAKNRIWQPETAAYKRFQFPVHEKASTKHEAETAEVLEALNRVRSQMNEVEPVVQSAAQDNGAEGITGVTDSHNVEVAVAENPSHPDIADIEKIEQQAYQKGYEEGRRLAFEEASRKVAEEAQQELQQAENYQAITDNLRKELEKIKTHTMSNREQLTVWLGQVVEEVCRQVVRREVHTGQDQIVPVIRETLGLIPENNEYTIHVNARDEEFLSQLKPDFGVPWQLVVSQEIAPGDCRIVSADGEAEAHMESRLLECLDIVRESLPVAAEVS